MAANVPLSELVLWMARYRLDPFGEQRADYRNALSILWTLRAAGVKKKLTVEDFMDFRYETASAVPARPDVHPVEALLMAVGAEAAAAKNKGRRKNASDARNRNPRTRR